MDSDWVRVRTKGLCEISVAWDRVRFRAPSKTNICWVRFRALLEIDSAWVRVKGLCGRDSGWVRVKDLCGRDSGCSPNALVEAED